MNDTTTNQNPSALLKSDLASIAPESLPPAQFGIMIDIESLDVGPRSVIMQIAMHRFSIDEGESTPNDMMFHTYLGMQPQLDFVQPRTISADTLAFWMRQPDNARKIFEQITLPDMASLRLAMRAFVLHFEQMTRNKDAEYEVIANGAQFDIVNIESLLTDLGMTAPWAYYDVVDLRTMKRRAGVKTSDVEEPNGFIAHDARWDCMYQIEQYFECLRRQRRGD